MIKPSDLNPRQRKAFDTWRSIGLTEAAAMNALVEDGLVQLTDEEKVARTLRSIFPTLSEGQAKAAARGRNPEPPTDPHARIAESLKRSFGLSESQAKVAADGRDATPRKAPSKQPLSEAELAKLRPDPALIRDVICKIEELAGDLYSRGVPEEKALRESAFELMRAMPNDLLADWVARIAAFRWPWLYPSSGSSIGGTVSESAARKSGSSGRRSGTVRG